MPRDKFWHLFEIPAGTEVPESSKFEGPDWNPVFNANHDQIECKAAPNDLRIGNWH